ncbi:MAG: hypothetical protein COA96_08510 [SAR86 cluster bacterium]|uniref:Phosphatidylinositol-4-phosphate 5-kinase n=1 Tax=SAR86 cluster bacterium TaxID=2030880 RepID=A0A2A5B1B2_9GAMM|nr:MAG: hypothetical protein COA96_08510 [SAR86 cluster bacterium]
MKIIRVRAVHTAVSVFAFILLITAQISSAQSLKDVTDENCIQGDCIDGRGKLELSTPFGKGQYFGDFRDGEFHGRGRLEIPISFVEKAIYDGNWNKGIRSGRGTYWNGTGSLYIGQWRDDERNGQGTYFHNLPRWGENEHSEFWMKENTENYSGEFVDDNYQGKGIYRWADGRKYDGSFFANNKHGSGTFYFVTGVARTQVWNYGDFVRWD